VPAPVPPAQIVLKQVKLRTAHNKTLDAAILIAPNGRTLYHFTLDKAKKIACTGKCAQFWPPLLIKKGAEPSAGKGINAKKLGTIKRPNGRYQVTYYGWPLYTFLSDKKAGDVFGEGVEKTWFAVSPSGKLVKQASGG
jgi:predicted lipoprotein with Yx(FWY)xxD motif